MNSLVNGPAGGEQASQESISGAEVYAGQSSSPLSFGKVKSGLKSSWALTRKAVPLKMI